ncbi:hypothetical protein PC116_g28745 [Phytophthora cactorum]|nr:hypothetical protein PC116_g28745 [Phytophthora cactorum]
MQITEAPRWASSWHVAAPIPDAPPVTAKTFEDTDAMLSYQLD